MIYNVLSSIFGPSKDNSPFQLKFNCPQCAYYNFGIPDGKYNLEINLNNSGNVCNCWKCGEVSGSLYYTIKKFATKEQLNEYLKYEKNANILNLVKKYKIYKLPKEFISFKNIETSNPLHNEALNYVLNDRKVEPHIIERDNIGFCLEGPYKDKIIIPSYDKNNKINFFISRSFKKEEKSTYRLPYGNKKEIIFNERNINWNSTVYIVEAYFEYTVIPFNTIILIGKSMYDLIIEKIILYKPKVVICLNPDAIEKRDNFTFKQTPSSSLEIKDRLLSLDSELDINVLYYNNENDLNKNLQDFGKLYIFDLLKNNIKK